MEVRMRIFGSRASFTRARSSRGMNLIGGGAGIFEPRGCCGMTTVEQSITTPVTMILMQRRDTGIRVNEDAREIKTSGFRFPALPALDLISEPRKAQVHFLNIEFVVRRIRVRQ